MTGTEQHRRQDALLIRVLSFVAEETAFDLKGGTAMKLFVRDIPRLGGACRSGVKREPLSMTRCASVSRKPNCVV
jgi:hypothetical protein